MNFKQNTNKKLISSFLIILMLAPAILFSIPRQTNAQEEFVPTGLPTKDVAVGFWTKLGSFFGGSTAGSSSISATQNSITAANTTKELLIKALQDVLRLAARRLLAQMTQSTVNWINTGFHGAPLFLENPGSFFKDIGKSEIKDLVGIIGYNSSSYPFGKSTAINTIDSYKQTFASNAQYSLSKVINDPALLNNYRTNFSTGGWDGFLLNTQYPQNNYIGFQLMYADELARRLQGTDTNQADIIKTTLAQGQGFLSPQTCQTNPNYNNLNNQFNKPTFKCSLPHPEDCSLYTAESGMFETVQYNDCAARQKTYDRQCAIEKAAWNITNDCTKPDGSSGLINTTPGSVVAGQIIKAIGASTFDSTVLAGAMGNSLSAIFDALLNKLMSSGLNAISSKISGTGNTSNNDNFSYDGHTLGSPSVTNTGSGNGFDFGGPDQEVVLGTFKSDVQNSIENANREMLLIDNTDPNNPGVLQVFAKIWPKAEELDTCLPGPDFGWEDRLGTETQKADQVLQGKMLNPDPQKVSAATAAHNELQIAVNSFKAWLGSKINAELPSGGDGVYAVNSVKAIQDQADTLAARKNAIRDTLINLQSIQGELGPISSQPAPGSGGETVMVRLRQRFDSMLLDLPSAASVSGMQNTLDDAKAKLANINTLITKCQAERTAKGWGSPGGADSAFSNGRTEEDLFCSAPIVGGYTHTPFINTAGVTYPELPLVNADNVYPDSSGVSDSDRVDIKISCDAVFKASVNDYKKNLPN